MLHRDTHAFGVSEGFAFTIIEAGGIQTRVFCNTGICTINPAGRQFIGIYAVLPLQ